MRPVRTTLVKLAMALICALFCVNASAHAQASGPMEKIGPYKSEMRMAQRPAPAKPVQLQSRAQEKSAEGGSDSRPYEGQGPQKSESAGQANNSPGVPLIIELYSLKVRFEKDGTGTRQFDVRVKAGSAEGIEQLKTLAFDYNATNEKFALKFLRVTKADGTVVEAKADAVTDGPAPAAKSAPAFSELREARVAVPAMKPGDTLSYEVVTSVVKPAAPGEFWFSHHFLTAHPAQDEELQINVPADVKIELHNEPQFPPTISTEGSGEDARKIYSWKRVNAPPTGNGSAQENQKPPDVALTTFASWQAFGKWFASNENAAMNATPAVSDKAKELIAEQKTDADKIEALYEFVAKQIHLVRIPPEQTEFQIHDAAKVLSAGYGDDFDKCALLAAMLRADSFSAEVALLPTAKKFEAQFVWPGAIAGAVVTASAGKETFWMDPAPDTLPFRLLLPDARGKQALVASSNVVPYFAETPLDPPFQSTQDVNITANVSSLGKMTARVCYVLRGDNEFALRTAFEETPQSEWKGLTQTMATLDGLNGTVVDTTPSDPTATREPFTLDFVLVRPDFLDWSQKRVLLPIPLPNFGLPNAPANPSAPVQLGSPLDVSATLTLRLPANDTVHAPVGAGVTRDYADYHSTYNATEHSVTVKRTLRFIARELPAAKRDDYQSFSEAVQADQSQGLVVDNIIPGVPEDATSPELMEAGTSELRSGRFFSALQLFQQVQELNPQQPNLPLAIGTAQLQLGKYDDAIASFQKQIAANPKDETVNTLLGVAYFDEKKYAEAEAAFKKQLELKPLDSKAYADLGAVYNDQKRFDEARAELEKAAVLDPQSAIVQLRLGEAEIGLKKTDAALAAFEKAATLSPTAVVANEIAYTLAENKLALDRAKEYADSAVDSTENSLSNVDLRHVNRNNLDAMNALPAFWDTLGWVYFQQGKIAQAEPLISAAWRLNQTGDVADHLGQIYQARGEKELAMGAFAEALAAGGASPDTRERLRKLLGTSSGNAANAAIELRVKRAKAEMIRQRTISLGKASTISGTTGKAELIVLIEPGPNGPLVREAKFVAGSDKLAGMAERLRSASFPPVLPRGTRAHIVLRGAASCSKQTGKCEFVFDRPRDLLAMQR
jgi:tetratricopeptide (TPR) repeat protein